MALLMITMMAMRKDKKTIAWPISDIRNYVTCVWLSQEARVSCKNCKILILSSVIVTTVLRQGFGDSEGKKQCDQFFLQL